MQNILAFHLLVNLMLYFFHVLQQADFHVLQFINHNRFRPLDPFFIGITNIATVTSYSFPVILLIYGLIKKKFVIKRKAWLILFSMIVNSAIIDIIKNFVRRPRPFITHPGIHNLVRVITSSFPSGHAGEVFMLATSFTLLFNKKKEWLVIVWFWAAVISYTRMALGVHYPSDIFGAAVISIIIAFTLNTFLIRWDFLKERKKVELPFKDKK